MASFDLTKNWSIIVPANAAAVKKAGEDLNRCIKLLAGRLEASVLTDTSADPLQTPVIILNFDSGSPEGRGFSWKLGEDRLEITGQGEGGLCKGIYNFLSTLGFKWPEPVSTLQKVSPKGTLDKEILPPWEESNIYSIKTTQVRNLSVPEGTYKRLAIPQKSQSLQNQKKLSALMRWAIKNSFDALILPFNPIRSYKKKHGKNFLENAVKEAALYGLIVEAGGWIISSFVPRKLFFFHRELFRMEGGKRQKQIHFCPTSPETIAKLRSESKKLFLAARGIDTFHLWPEEGKEHTWCACPSCRAFSIADQYRIAVNAIGDSLAELSPGKSISILEHSNEEELIPLRPNIFVIGPRDFTRFQY